ncbi:class I SAM-dependent methyltransferase [Halomonas denitrificans]|uniref:class I SAM-dependent methyltransferase n=1 Tax=Halomonas TaxID=2745 RepID=UPI001C95C3F2|nr:MULTISPECIES: class I SAM-dependent methyltransferase [Halomonas]MEE3214957.1 class I SAM-dependent methyltransferase [Pseudomonadota bacterium]MBY5929550.1 class I SAM-dependent methyltransferase [Halomonas sp. DP8Y7-3]MBY6028471.1 class I SAM-dependent methyltransferase [Halomonas sp. DP8Y7-1]MBY6207510.1 class I SAM-dependent methyltransferase [Halomonas sp. DP3Y7-2]MBY6228319.1 class I SAM-dependent methyltransferase [Halomonas sp. DP3Y7-1]
MINTTRWNRWRYSLYAPVYDVVAERAFRRPRRQALAQVRWQSGMRVLLVGAGTGLDLPWLPRDIEVHASDLCPAMVKRLKVRANHLGVDVEARAMDAEQLDYPDGYFDVVVMHLILAVMPQPDRGLAEAYRVLGGDGQLCIMDKFQDDERPSGMLRRSLNLATTTIATDITRQAAPLLTKAGFVIEQDTAVLMGKVFRALLACKAPPTSSTDPAGILR